MLMPIVCLVALASLYDRFADLPDVHSGMLAAAAGAVGLTVGTSIKLGRTIMKSPVAVIFAAASFVAIGLLHFPIIVTMLCLVPLAMAAGLWSERR
jgi:chromate transporter